MFDEKAWYMSKSVWGGIFSALGGVSVAVLNYDLGDPSLNAAALVSFLGGAESIYGRIKAFEKIK